MGPAEMRQASGHIIVVQEERFRLLTDTGQGLLLTLAHDAPLEGSDLCRLRDTNTHVLVEYAGEPNVSSGVAHSIRMVDGQ